MPQQTNKGGMGVGVGGGGGMEGNESNKIIMIIIIKKFN